MKQCLPLALGSEPPGEWGDTHFLFLNTTVSVSLDNTFVCSLALLLSTKIVFSSVC